MAKKDAETRVWLREGGEYECPHMELFEFEPGESPGAISVNLPVKVVNRWFKAMNNMYEAEAQMQEVYDEARRQLRAQQLEKPAPPKITKQRYLPGIGWFPVEVR